MTRGLASSNLERDFAISAVIWCSTSVPLKKDTEHNG